MELSLGFGIGPVAKVLKKLYAGAFAQAQGLGGGVDDLNIQHIAQLVEVVVTGVPKGFHGVQRAVGPAVIGVNQTLGLKAGGGVFHVNAFVPNGFHAADGPGIDTGNHHGHFVGRAGGIGGLQGPVQQGGKLLLQNIVVVLPEGGKTVGGVAGAGQNLAGAHIDDHHRAALGIGAVGPLFALGGVFAALPQVSNQRFQSVLGGGLQGKVNGKLHILSGHGPHFHAVYYLVIGPAEGAVGVGFVYPDAVDAVEVFFKGFLQAVLAYQGVHGIAVFFLVDIRPLAGGDRANVSENVGGIFGVVFPGGGGFGLQARGVQLQNGGQSLTAGVCQEHVVGKIGDALPQVQLIADADDGPGVGIGPGFGNAVVGTELLNQQRSGNVRVQAALFRQVFLEIALPGGAHLVENVGKGSCVGDGEVVGVFDVHIPAKGYQLKKIVIAAGGTADDIVVEHQVVAGPVADQDIAVAVGDFAPGGLDPGFGGVVFHVVHHAAGFDDLLAVKFQGEKAQHQAKQKQDNAYTESGYSLHVSPPMLLIAEKMGYRAGITARESRPVTQKSGRRDKVVRPRK